MISVKLFKSSLSLIILFQLIFSSITFSSFAQTQQSYRNHEEIDIGGGMKVEILKCSGEGPTEICDCIYFTDKRQNGTRMKQNANRIKEEERAAEIAKGISKPETKKSKTSATAALNNSRADKAIPASIIPKPKVPGQKPAITLEEAVKQADSVAKVGSQKMMANMAKDEPAEDSTEMDKVFIPKVTTAGGTQLELSHPKVNAEKTSVADTIASVKETRLTVAETKIPVSDSLALKDASAKVNSSTITTIVKDTTADLAETHTPVLLPATINTPAKTTKAPASKGASVKVTTTAPVIVVTPPTVTTPAKTTSTPNLKDTADVNAAAGIHVPTTNTPVTPSSTATIKDTMVAISKPVATVVTSATTVADTAVNAALSAKDKDQASLDTAEVGWVKQYQNINIEKKNTERIVDSIQAEVKQVDSVNVASTEAEKTANKNETKINNATTATLSVVKDADVASATVIKNDVEKEVPVEVKTNASTTAFNVIGRSAEVNVNGEWEKASIVDKETELLYKVHYIGKSSTDDEWVAVTQIKNIDSTISVKSVKPANTNKPKANADCSFEAPAPPVSNAASFSEKIAKRKIYENYAAAKKSNGKTGVTFLSLKLESAYVNTVSISAANKIEVKLALAPTGAMIYPVKTEIKVCEQASGKTTSKTVNSTYACFRNKQGAWTCSTVE